MNVLLGLVVACYLVAGCVCAVVAAVALWRTWQTWRSRPAPPPLPRLVLRPPPITIRIHAASLRAGDRALLPASMYRNKIEEIRAIERQPLGGVVAMVQSDDEYGMPVIRPHEWEAAEMVTIMVDDFRFDLDRHGGDYGSLYGAYGRARK
jgi:hypothetical protein